MRPSGSRSMRTLREGSDVALDFGMEELALPVPNVRWILSCFRSKRVRVLREQSAAKQKARAFHEQGRSLRYPIRQSFSQKLSGRTDMNYPSLFSPLQIGPYRLNHRLVM